MSAAQPRAVLSGIQLLRGLAATMVVLSHTNTMMSHPEFFSRSPFGFLLTGEFAVAIFFVISGFIIAYVSLDASWSPRVGVRDFAWRRAVRILPFMWLCVIGYNVLSYAGTHRIEWAPMTRALVLWPVGELKPNVLWSLRHEWMFYVLFALAMLGGRRRLWILGLWFAAPLATAVVLTLAPGLPATVPASWAELGRVVLLGGDNGANLQFACGFALGLLRLRGHSAVTPRVPGGLYVTVAATVLADLLIEASPPGSELARSLLWTGLGAMIVWLALSARPSNDALAKAGTVLGDASFSIYLVHNPTLLVQFALAQRFARDVPLEYLYPVFVGVALAIGIGVHYLVEGPLIRILSHGIQTAPWRMGRPRRFERR